ASRPRAAPVRCDAARRPDLCAVGIGGRSADCLGVWSARPPRAVARICHRHPGRTLRVMKTIFFDFGNVIASFDHRRATRRFARRSELTEADILAAIYDGPLEDDFEAGKLTVDDFLRSATVAIGYGGTTDDFAR